MQKKIQIQHIVNLLFIILLLIGTTPIHAQDDLDDLLDGLAKEKEPETEYIHATFESPRVINMHTVEKVAPGTLEFRISHRFGTLGDGPRNLFGLDQATIRFAFEYGLNDRIMLGLGRSTYQKTYDAFIKASLLQQSTGKKSFPVSVVGLFTVAMNTDEWPIPDRDNKFASRFAYTYQVLVARKFSKKFSFQLAPTIVHHNLVRTAEDINTIPAMGFAAAYRFNSRLSLNVEYFLRIPTKSDAPNIENYYNSFGIGLDLETGGHVFQFHLTNSSPMIEKGFITETARPWFDGDAGSFGDGLGIHLGFNITRQFTVNKKKLR